MAEEVERKRKSLEFPKEGAKPKKKIKHNQNQMKSIIK